MPRSANSAKCGTRTKWISPVKSPSQEDLLGYLLGALDAREQEQVQQLIDQQPRLEEKLLAIKAALAPLEQLDEPQGPPPGLARRCCQFVAMTSREMARAEASEFAAAEQAEQTLASNSPRLTPLQLKTRPSTTPFADEHTARLGSGWSLMDLVFACTAAMLVGAILLPALSAARFNSRVTACQNNLRSVYNSLAQYAENHEGHFPEIPESGPLSTAGYVGPLLKSEGLLENEQVFACAGLAGDGPIARIPTTNEILAAKSAQELQSYRQRMLGNYGYSIGYLENGKHSFPKNLGQSNFVLLADAPHSGTPARTSLNHGGWGQNCAMADGSIQFNRTGFIGNDAIYVNDRNVVAPGVSPADAVVAPSHIEPFATSTCLQ